jgi:hypothetical protein
MIPVVAPLAGAPLGLWAQLATAVPKASRSTVP